MISVEQSFYRRFPALAQGPGRAFSRPVLQLLRRIACESRITATLDALAGSRGFDFVEQALALFRFDYRTSHTDRQNIPAEGRVVLVANHPLGALDALSLLHLVGSVRRDVWILGNDLLSQLEPLQPLLIPTPVFGRRGPGAGMRDAFRVLQQDAALIVFPAGEVSRIRTTGVRDCRWNPGFVRFARRTGAPVLPVHIEAYNSPAFYGLSLLAPPLATLMLPREMFNARAARISISVGAAVGTDELQRQRMDDGPLAARMRRHVYRLPSHRTPLFRTVTTVAHPLPAAEVRRGLRDAECLGETRDGKRILLLDARRDHPVMREIGRLREVAFRRVGEGSGRARDLDRFDDHYRHIVLWDDEALQIAGAYRVGEVARILDCQGIEGLYSASLFQFSPHAVPLLRQSIELGRSFVQPRYWGSRSLDYLWQGIGAYLRTQPQIRHLLGPVSISARLPAEARDLIVLCHQHCFGDREGLARARRPHVCDPLIVERAAARFAGSGPEAGLRLLQRELEALGTQLPILYRQYVELCEPAGVRFLDFAVDPEFGNCIDGLIMVDLDQVKPARRARYLEARAHSGTGAGRSPGVRRRAH